MELYIEGVSSMVYIKRVKELFKSGKATKAQWDEMALAVLAISENDPEFTKEIDKTVDPKRI